MNWLLRAHTDGRAYTTLAYLLVSLPLGIAGFVVVVTGLSLGIGLLVTVAGIPVLVATMLFALAFASLSRRLAWSLLDAPMPNLAERRPGPDGVFWRRLVDLGGRPRTWRAIGFAILSLPLGVVGFAIAASILWVIVAPLVYLILVSVGVSIEFASLTVDTAAKAMLFVPMSVLFMLAGPRLLLGFGTVMGRVVTGLIGVIEPAEIKQGVVDVLVRTGEADGFAIYDGLRMRFGRGPFVSPLNVEATLLALEGAGRIERIANGGLTSYRLASPDLLPG